MLYAWAKSLGLPPGRSKRRLLAMLLVLPLVTAAWPGRTGLDFRERFAWLDSGRVLAIPLPGPFAVYHVALAIAALAIGLTLWQEVLPALRRPRTRRDGVPDALGRFARALPGWARCETRLADSDDLLVATSGWPWRPRLIVSRGALDGLTAAELAAVVRHEHAHWRSGRWARSHLLFLVRLLQSHSPAALWAFREYCLEVEVDCDAAAARDTDRRLLARTLLKVYDSTDRRDVAARSALRRRIDVLLDGPRADPLTTESVVAASVLLALVLPWIV